MNLSGIGATLRIEPMIDNDFLFRGFVSGLSGDYVADKEYIKDFCECKLLVQCISDFKKQHYSYC